MSILSARLRRWTYLTHRWCGIAGCLLMALWFASGVVMLFVGYPKLTPWDRLQALPAVQQDGHYLLPSQVLSGRPATRLVFNAAPGQPRYAVRDEHGAWTSIDAESGQVAQRFGALDAMQAARLFSHGAQARYLGEVQEDRWTHSGALDAHRPLHQVQMEDDAATLLYVSSRTGEVVMQAPRLQRLLNFAGAWLHWLYLFKTQPDDAVWTWTVIILSSACVVVACSGILVGVWRWRFARPYKSGSRSPFAPGWMRWHHLLGLSFAAITLTWIFSGLMSMNPLGIFSPRLRPDLAAYAGAQPGQRYLDIAPQTVLRALHAQQFAAVELEWKNLAGRPFILARDGHDQVRLVLQQDHALDIRQAWSQAELLHAAAALLPAPVTSTVQLRHYDAYYYRRDPEAMMGGSQRRLPVLKLGFGDVGQTDVYIDLQTGQPELSADRAQRVGRWLFSFLHSWDLRPMLAVNGWREAILVLLSLGGLALTVSGVVIACRRLRRSAAR